MATVGENRALRDQYNVLLRQLRTLQEQYNRDRPGIGQDYQTDVTTFRAIATQTNQVLFQMEQLKTQNNQNLNIFDPQLNQGIEQNISAGQDVIRASQQVVDLAEQAQRNITANKAQEVQGSGAESSGEIVAEANQARDDAAQTQAPSPPPESATDSGEITVPPAGSQPTNAEPTPTTGSIPAGPAIPPAAGPRSTDATTASETVSTLPVQQTQDSPPAPEVRQTYYYKTISVTSTFSGGKFTQEIEGALLITPVRRLSAATSQPVTATGTQTDTGEIPGVTVFSGGSSQTDPGEIPGVTVASAAGLSTDGLRVPGTVSSIGNNVGLPPVPKIPSASALADTVKALPVDAGVLAPALKNLPTSGGAQIGLFGNAVNTNIGAALSSGTPDSELIYTGNDEIVWDRINQERLRRGLPGLAAIGYPRPPDDRNSTQIGTYNTARET
jgi:hypothetical protein